MKSLSSDSTPCIGICSTTYGDQVCRGCKRTYKEVISWNTLSWPQKQQFWQRYESFIQHNVEKFIYICNQELLLKKCEQHQIAYHSDSSPLFRAYKLLQKGAGRIQDLSKYGLAKQQDYNHLTAVELFAHIDEALYQMTTSWAVEPSIPAEI